MRIRPELVEPDGEKCRKMRTENGLSQKQVEAKSAIHVRTIQKIEHGVPVMMISLKAFAEAVGAKFDELKAGGTSRAGPLPEPNVRPLCDCDSYPEDRREGRLGRSIIRFDGFIADRLQGVDKDSRNFILAKIRGFLDDEDFPSGYILITGDPGIGKSALLAKAVKELKIGVHHFMIAAQGINTARQFIYNISARLMSEYSLCREIIPKDCCENGVFLNELLQEAADARRSSARVLVAIDALDEAALEGRGAPAQSLLLPVALPKGVYVIISARRRVDLGLQGGLVRHIEMVAQSPENEADVHRFIRRHLKLKGIQGWMRKEGLEEKGFIDKIWKKSKGNFMYLRHFLPAINEGTLTLSADDLPFGLKAYYQYHWETMKARIGERFQEIYEPVVCTLAAAKTPVTTTEISEWTGCRPGQVTHVLKAWNEFLQQAPGQGRGRQWSLYHSAFREFLEQEVSPGLEVYHERIADHLLKKVGYKDRKQA